MRTITLSALLAEVHVRIAEQCENSDLINLCLTSTLVHGRNLRAVYRHVDLRLVGPTVEVNSPVLDAQRKRQLQFMHTLLRHPEYSHHVQSFKGMLNRPTFDDCRRLGEKTI